VVTESEMVPLPPEEEEAQRPGWVIPLGIVSAILVVALGGYLAWSRLGGQSGRSLSFLAFLSRGPASATRPVPTLMAGLATATPSGGSSLPTSTPSVTLESPTATPTAMATDTPRPTETPTALEATEQPPGDENSDEMPPTGIGTAYLVGIATALGVVLVLARVLRSRYQG